MFKLNLSVFIVLMCIVVGPAQNTVFAGRCDPNLSKPDFLMHGLAFGPYNDDQGPGDYIPVEQIREKLEIVAPHTEWVRSYSATNGLEEIPFEARKLGLKVAMGTWIRDYNEGEVDNLVAKAQAGYVDIAIVGNEELVSQALDANELLTFIGNVRQRFNDANCPDIAIAIAEPFGTWANAQPGNLFERDPNGDLIQGQIIEAVDILFVNIYPFFEGVHIDNAATKLEQMYLEAVTVTHEVDPNKLIFISETGWPTEGLENINALPSLTNAARYFFESVAWAKQDDIPMFYFEAFDESWKEDPCDPSPWLVEDHWGIWDTNNNLKPSFNPDQIFCEDFDPPVNSFCPRVDEEDLPPEPNIQTPDNSDGQFLRLLYDGNVSRYSSAAFDRVGPGAFCRIVAEFDFRMHGPDPQPDADGFSLLLLPTSENDVDGCSTYIDPTFLPDFPRLPQTFGVGFSVYKDDEIYVSWDGKPYPSSAPIPVSVNLDSGDFHRARIELHCVDSSTARITVVITPDVYDPNHLSPVTIVENLTIGDPNNPFSPYENRIEFAGRNGGQDINADIDNIYVSYKFQVCNYILSGDANGDCMINLFDLALLANNWLINCNLTPDDPACIPK